MMVLLLKIPRSTHLGPQPARTASLVHLNQLNRAATYMGRVAGDLASSKK